MSMFYQSSNRVDYLLQRRGERRATINEELLGDLRRRWTCEWVRLPRDCGGYAKNSENAWQLPFS